MRRFWAVVIEVMDRAREKPVVFLDSWRCCSYIGETCPLVILAVIWNPVKKVTTVGLSAHIALNGR